MRDEFKMEVGASIECKNCGKRSSIPALKIVPGVKCVHCGAVLELGLSEAVQHAYMLNYAAGRDDVKID